MHLIKMKAVKTKSSWPVDEMTERILQAYSFLGLC